MNVLITGATSGIGKSLVELYYHKGVNVIACGRNIDKLNHLKTEFPTIEIRCFDITNPEQTAGELQPITALDIAILNAGDCEYIDDVVNFDAALFQRVINVNLVSIGYLLQALLPKLNSGSTLALMGSSVTYLPFPRAQAYGASKAGLAYLADSLRLELSPKNIQVSLIEPGFVKTPLTDKNNFDMPFLITREQAAERIFKGISSSSKRIRFPKRFIFLMKFIAILPDKCWQAIALSKPNKKIVKGA